MTKDKIETNAAEKKETATLKKFAAPLLYIAFVVMMIFTISQKCSYFQDELLSYCLANNNEVVVKMAQIAPGVVGNITGMRLAQGFRYTPAFQAFEIMTSVPVNARFNYANVWKNQAEDTHPPLFYLILHTICSFFPGTFSPWYGGIINIFFALWMLFIARKLVREYTDSDFIRTAVSVVFVFSSAILNSTSFFRMYEMTAFWVMLQTYLFVRQTGKPVTNKFLLQIFLVTLGGALTHYYCVMYLFFLACVFGVILLRDRDYKGAVRFSLSQFGAGAAALAIFPAMFTHVFRGDRGTEFVHNALFLSDYAKRISAYWGLVNGQLYGRLLPVFVLLVIALWLYNRANAKAEERAELCGGLLLRKYNLVLVPMLFYFFSLSKIAPVLAEGAWADIKYLYPVFATALVVFMTYCFAAFEKLAKADWAKRLIVVSSLAVIVCSFLCTEWDDFYLYRHYRYRLPVKDMYADTDCVCFYANIIPKYLFELSHYRTLTLYPFSSFNPAGFRRYLAEQRPAKLVFCIATQGGEDTDKIVAMLNPEIQDYSVNKIALGGAPIGATYGDGGAIYHLSRVRP